MLKETIKTVSHIKPRGQPRQNGTIWPSKKKSLHSKHNKENTVPDKPYQKHLSSVQACWRKEVQTVALDRPPLIEKQDQGNKVPMKRPLLLPSDEISKFESCKKKSKTSAMWKIGTSAYQARMNRESKHTNTRSVSVDLTMERSDMAVDDLPSFASPWEVLDADMKRLEIGGWLNIVFSFQKFNSKQTVQAVACLLWRMLLTFVMT